MGPEYVQVPTAERCAVHKLILTLDRPVGIGKRDKDLGRAARLLEVLAERRPEELKYVWEEARGRGPKWRNLLLNGMRPAGVGTYLNRAAGNTLIRR
jgi:hypothetical protein